MYLRNSYILTVTFSKYFSKDGVWVGHLLSGYSLPMDAPSQVNGKTSGEVAGMWKHSIKVSYEATKAAFPGGEVIAHLDHKYVFLTSLVHLIYRRCYFFSLVTVISDRNPPAHNFDFNNASSINWHA
jgi:hypothetical protein